MQAVIVAGGKGTRLRPFTLRSPKPLLPLLEVPFLEWMVLRCKAVGLTDISINVGYLGEQIEDYFGTGDRWDVKIRFVREETPLDTAGSLLLAKPYFTGEPLVVFNADILTDLDLAALMDWHRQSGAAATLTLTRVDDITAFGLVEVDGNSRILAFREKPSPEEAAQISTDTINAGTYVLEPSIFDRYPAGEPLSFERAVFPGLLERGEHMSAFVHEGYWRDLGKPPSYYQGQIDILEKTMAEYPIAAEERSPGVWIHPEATVDPDAKLQAPCYVGARSKLGPNASLPAGTIINSDCWIDSALLPGVYASGTLAA
ncbi:NDP-sugar synthase [Synechococcus sp. PCC 7336]|uniref:nucleotidyltransferase family protein n=1 Tax=Synechococcus sp. PCC 7336 TaxID=195250 RepID=UPI000348907C|nr:NDP-sugar synthase [Synechococcus sp. PCC 7336]